MDYHIDWSVTNSTLWIRKPSSPCNDTHWSVQSKSKGGKPKGGGGDKGGGNVNSKGGGGDKGGRGKGNKASEGAPYGRGHR